MARRNDIRILLAAAIGLVASLSSGCSTYSLAGRLVSTRNEILLGDKMAPEMEMMLGGKVADESIQSYVQEVGRRLAAGAERRMPYEFYVVESDVPNAFSLPGGRVYLTAGLLDALDSERELAALLACEVAHVSRRDPIKVLYDAMGGMLLVRTVRLAIEDTDETGYLVARKLAREIIRGRHTRREKVLADEMAMKYMSLAGYNPWGLPEYLANVHNRNRLEPGSVTMLLRSHPLTDKRFKLAKLTAEVDYHYFTRSGGESVSREFRSVRERLDWYRSAIRKEGMDPRLVHLEEE